MNQDQDALQGYEKSCIRPHGTGDGTEQDGNPPPKVMALERTNIVSGRAKKWIGKSEYGRTEVESTEAIISGGKLRYKKATLSSSIWFQSLQ